MQITSHLFGNTASGEQVWQYVLKDGSCEATVITYGGSLQRMLVPDKNGKPTDVVLGFDTLAEYQAQNACIGALLGRCAGRIANGRAVVDGKELQLEKNDRGVCHLHGGKSGFHLQNWAGEVTEEGLVLRYISEDGDGGYPGRLITEAIYALQDGTLSLTFRATSDKDTICSLSGHSYFNLGGQRSGSIGKQKIFIPAEGFTPLDENNVVNGTIQSVDGTPLDFRNYTAFEDRWDADSDMIRQVNGLDHNFLVNGRGMRQMADVRCEETGIGLSVNSDLPCVQLYTANQLEGSLNGKEGAVYQRRNAFCLEAQFAPNAINCPAYESSLLKAGKDYLHRIEYHFYNF